MSGAGLRIGSFGTKIDIDLVQGENFPLTLKIRNPPTVDPVTGLITPGTSIDLTGSTLQSQIRRKALDSAILASFVVVIVDAVAGIVTLTLSATVTAGIRAGETLSDTLSHAVWDMKLIDSLGFPRPVCYGDVTILRRVTRGS